MKKIKSKNKTSKKEEIKNDDEFDNDIFDEENLNELENIVEEEPISSSDEESKYEDEIIDKDFLDQMVEIKKGGVRKSLEKNRQIKYTTIIPAKERKTSDVISKFEYTEAVSIRASHISQGSEIYTEIGDETNSIRIAEKEIREHKCPLNIVRHLNNNTVEIWEINELIIPYFN